MGGRPSVRSYEDAGRLWRDLLDGGGRPDLYLHIPVEVADDPPSSWKGAAAAYSRCLDAESRLLGLPAGVPVRSVYLGGGGPGAAARLGIEALTALLDFLRGRFDLSGCEQRTVELDFSCLGAAAARLLAARGFDRATGLFPLEPESPGLRRRWRDIRSGIRRCRQAGLSSVNLDLTADRARLGDSLSEAAARRLRGLRPDRIQVPDDWPARAASVRRFRAALRGGGRSVEKGLPSENIQTFPDDSGWPVLGLGWGARSCTAAGKRWQAAGSWPFFCSRLGSGRGVPLITSGGARPALEALLRSGDRDPGIELELARMDISKGRFASAMERVGRAVRSSVDGGILAGAAEAAAAAGARGEAYRLFCRAIECFPEDAGLLAGAAEAAAATGDAKAAGRFCVRALERSSAPSLLRRAASVFASIGDSASVLRCLEGLSRLFPRAPDLWVGRALHRARLGQTQAARDALNRARRLKPGPWVLRRAAEVYGELGAHDRARLLCRTLTAECPKELEFRISHAYHALRCGEEREGRRALAAARRLRRRGARASDGALRRMAETHALADDHAAAAELFRSLTRKAPGDGGLWLDLAYHQRKANAGGVAIASLRRALKRPLSVAQRRRAAGLFGELGRHALSREILRALVSESPGDISVRLEEAEAAARAGDRPRSRRLLCSALASRPRKDDVRRAALVFQVLGDFSEAVELLTPLTEDPRLRGDALKDRGICRHLGGDPAGAVADLEAALRFEPGLVSACISLGSVHESAGRFAEAAKAYRRGLGAAPRAGEEGGRRIASDCLRALARKLRKG